MHKNLSCAIQSVVSESSHVPLFKHGVLPHSSMSTLQCGPDQPLSHTQRYSASPSTHELWCEHGYDAQSSSLVTQLVPLKPGAHVQLYDCRPSAHVPPFRQCVSFVPATSPARSRLPPAPEFHELSHLPLPLFHEPSHELSVGATVVGVGVGATVVGVGVGAADVGVVVGAAVGVEVGTAVGANVGLQHSTVPRM